jgi:hypothetical protein
MFAKELDQKKDSKTQNLKNIIIIIINYTIHLKINPSFFYLFSYIN